MARGIFAMFTHKTRVLFSRFVILVTLGLVGGTGVLAAPGPQLGKTLDETSVSTLPKHVFADGEGLPEGGGNTTQGAELYAMKCAACHGSKGQGGSALELVGDRSYLTTDFPDKGIGVYWPYAPTLFEYIQRAMPPDMPYSLTADEVYAVIARVLELNGLVSPGQYVDSRFLSSINLPNRDGFRSMVDTE